MNSEESIKCLEKLNERVNEIFGIEKTEYINTETKIIGIIFNLSKKNENSNYTILLLLELLNLYIVPAFVLPNTQKNKTTEVVSIKMGDDKKKPIVTTIKRYIKQNNTYIESKQPEQQTNSKGFFQKIKNFISLDKKEEIEFTGINKDNLNLQISDSENTAVEVTFTASEINIQHIESILNCISNFRKLINNDAIKSLIEIDYNHSTVESQDKLNIYPFFAKKTVNKNQEIILCLITNQNNVKSISGIFRDSKEQLEIECGGNKYSLLSYSLVNPFSQNLVDFLLFFNDPSYNGGAKISNLQTIEKIFSEEIEIKDTQKSEEKNSKVKIKIENVTCFTSYLHYEDGCLKLKKSNSGEKIYFNFEVKIENCLDQIKKESEYIHNTTIYKIVSLISFFALCFNENKFSISVAVDGENIFSISVPVNEGNIFSIKVSLYSELVTSICKKLKEYTISLIKSENYANPKPQHVQILDLFRTKKVSFTLEAETQKIAINRLENIEHLMSSISILNSCRKEFLDNIDSPSVGCYLSHFLHTNNNLSCVYDITYQEDLSLGINFLQNELQKSFSRISNSLKQTKKGDKLLSYSMDIDISKSLAHDTNKSQKEEIVEITKVTEEEVKTESQKCIEIEYDVDWKKECFDKIKPTDNYTSLELGLKEACKFVHERILYVCKQLLDKIHILQLGKEQKVEQGDQLFIDELTIKAALDKNISSYEGFISKKKEEFDIIKQHFDQTQRNIIVSIASEMRNELLSYEEVANIHRFISKNATDLPKILKKNTDELEELIRNIKTSKVDQLVVGSGQLTEELKQLNGTMEQTEASGGTTYSAEKSLSCQSTGISNTKNTNVSENNNLSSTNSDKQTSCIKEDGEVKDQDVIDDVKENSPPELQSENDEEQENKITSEGILALFSELSEKIDTWENLNQVTNNNEGKNIYTLFHNLKSQISRWIEINQGQQEVELYKEIHAKIHNIYYSCLETTELEIRGIEGIADEYLNLDKKKEELKKQEAQLQQEINAREIEREIESDIIVSVVQKVKSVFSFLEKTINKTIHSQGQSQNSNIDNTEYLSNLSYNQNNYSAYNYNNQKSGYGQYNTECNVEVANESNSVTIDSIYSPKQKPSNFQKLKAGIKDAFSEKENYVFLTFSILAIAGILAYFIPGGLRKFVSSEKLNIVDSIVATGATVLIIISLAALAYSVHTSIVHSNMINPTASPHNTQGATYHK